MQQNKQHTNENIDILEDMLRLGKLNEQHVFMALPSLSPTKVQQRATDQKQILQGKGPWQGASRGPDSSQILEYGKWTDGW